ncbi:hypothetical protein QQ045_031998 [Rhodiola kirilowii]
MLQPVPMLVVSFASIHFSVPYGVHNVSLIFVATEIATVQGVAIGHLVKQSMRMSST